MKLIVGTILGVVAAGVLAALLAPAVCRAGTGSVVSLPTRGTKIKSGLRMTVDTRWVDGNGYRPVRIALSPLPPLPTVADRTLRVEVRPGRWYGMWQVAVSRTIEIPQGSTGVEATLSVPQSTTWPNVQVQVFEEGTLLKDLSSNFSLNVTVNQYGWSEATPSILFIDDDAPTWAQRGGVGFARSNVRAGPTYNLPDIRRLCSMFPVGEDNEQNVDYEWSNQMDDGDILGLLGSQPRHEMLPLADLPQRWIDYTCFDVAFISLGDLQRLAAGHPQRWQALRRWLASGPTLCVTDVGDEFARLDELQRLLQLPRQIAQGDDEPRWPGWTKPRPRDYRETIAALADVQQWRNQQMMIAQGGAVSPGGPVGPNGLGANRALPVVPPLVLRQVGVGRVVALRSEISFPGDRWLWGTLFNTLNANHWMWYRRHGLSLNRQNYDYWNFLIPGVGTAPVGSFLVLISLFVVAIGPVNYVLLRRARRLYLLLVTVPLSAAVISLGLFAYALLTDGLGVRVRVRSVTYLDQTNGRAVSWSRQSYFAGMAPSHGLSFPTDAAIYPIVENSEYDWQDVREIHWDEQQALRRGYLASRTTSQFMIVRSADSTARLRVRASAGASEPPRVENRLGTNVHMLAVYDARGEAYWAERLAEGDSAVLTPISAKQARSRLMAASRDHKPVLPKGFDPTSYRDFMGRRRYYYGWGRELDRLMSDPTFTTSILETNLRQNLGVASLSKPPKRSYLAVVQSSPEVPLGADSARQQASFHVIVGRW